MRFAVHCITVNFGLKRRLYLRRRSAYRDPVPPARHRKNPQSLSFEAIG